MLALSATHRVAALNRKWHRLFLSGSALHARLRQLSGPEPNSLLVVKVLAKTLTSAHFHNLGVLLEFQNIIDIVFCLFVCFCAAAACDLVFETARFLKRLDGVLTSLTFRGRDHNFTLTS